MKLKTVGLVVVGGVVGYFARDAKNFIASKLTERSTNGYEIEEYLIDDSDDVHEVLKQLNDYAETYGSVSAADYYDFIGVQSSYEDNAYGWDEKSIKKAKLVKSRQGYSIQFPPVTVL